MEIDNNIDYADNMPNTFYEQFDPIYRLGLANSLSSISSLKYGFNISCSKNDKMSK